MDFFKDHAVAFALVCAAAAVLYGLYLTYWLLQQPAGNERMREISGAVQEGAAAYLRKQYTTIAVVAIVPFLLIGFYNELGWGTAFGFLIGAVLSAAAGFIGMNVAVRVERPHGRGRPRGPHAGASRSPSARARSPACSSSASACSASPATTGSSRARSATSPSRRVDDLIGLAFGGSLISVFARLGGGIFTKAADVGADLVGKIEAGIPEDDPRNPAVIADNVGDNVGDCAGMAADLFETYAVTAVAVMLLGTAFPTGDLWLYPLALGGISILASVIGTFFARVGKGENAIINALYKGVIVADGALGDRVHPGHDGLRRRRSSRSGSSTAPRSSASAITFLLVAITEYYTGTPLEPGQVDRRGLADRSRDEHHRRASPWAWRRRPLPGDRDRRRRHRRVRDRRRSIYGIGVAVMAQLSMTGLIVALDAYGPVTDNAGGIAEMADLPESVRGVTDPLDAVGNTTKAVTKGYAIGSAGLAALILFDEYTRGLDDDGHRHGRSRSTTRT